MNETIDLQQETIDMFLDPGIYMAYVKKKQEVRAAPYRYRYLLYHTVLLELELELLESLRTVERYSMI